MHSPRLNTIVLALLAVIALAGCADTGSRDTTPDVPQLQANVSASFEPADKPGATAISYDPLVVPVGAKATVTAVTEDRTTTVRLTVSGLLANRSYGAHAHARPCGPTSDAAGPHYQHVLDPKTPGLNRDDANAANEIWLDFDTDLNGAADVRTTVDWVFEARRADSVVIDAQPTPTPPGNAGPAGARVGCITVDF